MGIDASDTAKLLAPTPERGLKDVALPCFALARLEKRPPAHAAARLEQKLSGKLDAARSRSESIWPVPEPVAPRNLTAAVGTTTIDGLGMVGGGSHSVDEHVVLEHLPKRAALLARLIETL